jgi:hypothetical protein
MMAEIKEAGWKVIFNKGDYDHKCPECVGKGGFEDVS